MTNDELLHKWVNQTISPEELAIFKKRPEYDSLVHLYKSTEDLVGPTVDTEAMLKEILATPKEKTVVEKNISEAKERKLFPSWLKYVAVASVLLLAGIFLWPKNQLVSYEVANNERLEGTLPDLSEFVLNADSKLSFNQKTWNENRNLELEGEAFFKVQTGSAFTVNTKAGKVQVLGTQFNVKSRVEIFEVNCTEGKVAVIPKNDNNQQILTAGQGIRINKNGTIEQRINESENAKSWVTGIVKMNDVTVREVIAELERQFDITIEIKGVNLAEKIVCNFQTKDLALALKTATSPLDLDIKIENQTKVILMQKGF